MLSTVTDFPVAEGDGAPEGAWVNENGMVCALKFSGDYRDLYFMSPSGDWCRLNATGTVEEDGTNYKSVDNNTGKEYRFIMQDNKLVSIVVVRGDEYDGTYSIAKAPETSEDPTPSDPTSEDPTPSDPTSEDPELKDTSDTSVGAIIGISIGIIVILFIIAYIVMYVVYEKTGKSLKFLIPSYKWIDAKIFKK